MKLGIRVMYGFLPVLVNTDVEDMEYNEELGAFCDNEDSAIGFMVGNPSSVIPHVKGARYFWTALPTARDQLVQTSPCRLTMPTPKTVVTSYGSYNIKQFEVGSLSALKEFLTEAFTEGSTMNPFVKERLDDGTIEDFYNLLNSDMLEKEQLSGVDKLLYGSSE